MEYQALYRKWRPQRFDEVVGQRHIVQTLQNAVKSGNVAHAYLFSGPRGSGKTTTARLLAKAMNCRKGPTPQPCNECDMCLAIAEGRAMDVIEMDAASSTSVDDVRELRETVRLAPAQARYKFYIIDEVHRLSRAAFDALLKTLEEPPPNVIFVLATTEPNKVPPTIASRCQRFDFRRGSEKEIKDYLKKVAEGEGVTIEESALSLLASRAEGSWRDALSLFEQVWAYAGNKIDRKAVEEVLGIVEDETLSRFVRAIANGNVGEGIRLIGDVLDKGKDPREFLKALINRFRNLLMVKVGGASIVEVEEEKRKELEEEAGYFSSNVILQMIESAFSTENLLRLSPSPRLPLEMLLVRLIQITGKLVEVEKELVKTENERKEIKKEVAVEEEEAVKIEVKKDEVKKEEAKVGVETRIDVGEIIERWEEVVRRVREKDPQLGVFLAKARPISIEGKHLTIGFPESQDVIRKHLERNGQKQEQLLSVLRDMFSGFSLNIRTTIVEEEIEKGEEKSEGKKEETSVEPEEETSGRRIFFQVFPEAKRINNP
ncbi:MAG: DNA polymerase III subunit gamma/tau [bacterium]